MWLTDMFITDSEKANRLAKNLATCRPVNALNALDRHAPYLAGDMRRRAVNEATSMIHDALMLRMREAGLRDGDGVRFDHFRGHYQEAQEFNLRFRISDIELVHRILSRMYKPSADQASREATQ